MFAPDVEARFKKIEDDLTVASEILLRFEMRAIDEIDHLKAVQDAMARWVDKMADRQDGYEARQDEYEAKLAEHEARHEARQAEHEAWQAENETKMNALIDAQVRLSETVAELSRTVDRFLKSRTDGQGN